MVPWPTKVERLADWVSSIQQTAVQKDVGSLLPISVFITHGLYYGAMAYNSRTPCKPRGPLLCTADSSAQRCRQSARYTCVVYASSFTMVLWLIEVERLASRKVGPHLHTADSTLLPVPMLCMHVLLPWYSGLQKSNACKSQGRSAPPHSRQQCTGCRQSAPCTCVERACDSL